MSEPQIENFHAHIYFDLDQLDQAQALARATQERFVYRHQWREGDMLMWDNRCTMHQVMPYDRRNQRRTMHRTALAGREPVIPAEAA